MTLDVSDEVFLIDALSMQVISANKSVAEHFVCDVDKLDIYDLKTLLGIDQSVLIEYLNNHRQTANLFTIGKKIDEQSYIYQDDRLKVLLVRINQQDYLIATKSSWATKKAMLQALDESESRFHAIVSNTPSLVFQFRFDEDGHIVFIFLSEACKALLGLMPEVLKKVPAMFSEMMLPEDRTSFEESITLSASELTVLNWEGRIWIDEWQDTKWINLRSSPRILNDGAIQWEGIMTNITQSKNEKHEIEQSRQRLAELSAHMEQIKEQERQRIGREIHDDLGGNLTAIKIGLSSIVKRIKPDQTELLEKAKQLEGIVDNTFEAAHRISGDLRPNILELGIVAAIEWQTKEFEKQIGVTSVFTSNQQELSVTQDQAITLFRICQEALFNIAKHAKAKLVKVALTADDREITLEVVDDGIGIEPSDMLKANSYGLRGMSERLTLLNGSFNIQRVAKSGTRIVVKLPCETVH